MIEKAEAKKKAAAEAANGQAQPEITRRQTMAKIIAKEERRISDSQVAGTQLSFEEQLKQAATLLKPVTKQRLSNMSGDSNEEKKEQASAVNLENNLNAQTSKATVYSLSAKISQALRTAARSKQKKNRNDSDSSDSDQDDESSDGSSD